MIEFDVDVLDEILEDELIVDHEALYQEHLYKLNVSKSKWKYSTACFDKEPDLMFPVKIEKQKIVAETICSQCDHIVDCLYFAIVSKEEFGVWGGTTQPERREIQKRIAADGFTSFKNEWDADYEEYIYSLSVYLVENPDDK